MYESPSVNLLVSGGPSTMGTAVVSATVKNSVVALTHAVVWSIAAGVFMAGVAVSVIAVTIFFNSGIIPQHE